MSRQNTQELCLSGIFGLASGLLNGETPRQKFLIAVAGSIVSYGAIKAAGALKNWLNSDDDDDDNDGDDPLPDLPGNGPSEHINIDDIQIAVPGLLEETQEEYYIRPNKDLVLEPYP